MANEFKIKKGLIVKGSEGKIVDVQGSTNELLSITDTSIGSLFSVNDLSGIPIIEVFDDNKIEVGNFNALEDFQLILKGDITANLLKKSGGTGNSILLDDGRDIPTIITIDLTQVFSVDIYASQNLKINSVTNINGTPTTTILVNDVAYTLGNLINQGDKITVSVDVYSVINLNIRYE